MSNEKSTKSKSKKTHYQSGANRRVEESEIEYNETTRIGVYGFTLAMFIVGSGLSFAILLPWLSLLTVAVSFVVGILCAQSVRIALHWEQVAILRFGKFNRIAGPGLYFCIPFFEYATIKVDHRIKTTSFSAEAALTADLVPVDVDAILFWMVWDAKKACLEVDNYPKAVLRSAQTAMRDAIGQLNLAEISLRRKQLDRELEEALGTKCAQWGVTVLSVEIRDIMIPYELQDALSKEAQAERERNARVILAEVEKDISEMYVEAADVYEKNPSAMQLRAMNLAYESAKDGKGLLLVPSSLADGFDVDKFIKGD